MFESLFGAGWPLPVQFLVAFVIVLVLIGATFWLIRRFGTTTLGGATATRGRQPRLAVIDAAAVDARRRLVLIRRDNVEHLLLLGGPTDVVVETAIVRGVPVQASVLREAAQAPAAPEPAPEPAPRLSMRDSARQAAGEPAPMRPSNLDLHQPAARAEPVRSPPPPPRAEPPRPAPPLRTEPPRTDTARPEVPKITPVVTPSVRSTSPTPPPAARQTPASAAPPQDDVAARLEAALRKPIGANPGAPAAKPANAGPAGMAPLRPAAASPASPTTAPKSLSADEKSVFDSLEEEMAALLGRGPTPPKA
jgi:flagellar protein FliO/FliZ